MAEATPTPARFKRMNPEPYLDKEKFDSEAEALEYLADPTCYAGHSVAVKGEDGKYVLRMVNDDADGQKVLDEVGVSNGGTADQVGDLTPEVIETKEGAQQKADTALASAKTYADGLIERLMNAPPETLDTLAELANALGNDPNFATTMANALAQKAGKTPASGGADGLMSAADKSKLDGIAAGANKTTVDAALSTTSKNPVQNKVIKAELDKKLDKAGGTLTGPIQYPTNAGASSSKYYIGVGSGHQVSTGKRGLKILSYEDYNNSAHGIGCDLHHPSNDMSFAMTTGSSSDIGYFTFSRVNRNSNDYELVAEIRTDGTIYAGGKKCVTEDELPERGSVIFTSIGIGASVASPVPALRVPLSELIPSDITPVAGKDYILHLETGVFGIITSSDISYLYVAYATALLITAVQS